MDEFVTCWHCLTIRYMYIISCVDTVWLSATCILYHVLTLFDYPLCTYIYIISSFIIGSVFTWRQLQCPASALRTWLLLGSVLFRYVSFCERSFLQHLPLTMSIIYRFHISHNMLHILVTITPYQASLYLCTTSVLHSLVFIHHSTILQTFLIHSSSFATLHSSSRRPMYPYDWVAYCG